MSDIDENTTSNHMLDLGYDLSRETTDMRETNLLRDVAFNRHSMQDGEHHSPYDNGKIQIGTDGIVVRLTQGINEDQFRRTLSNATRATLGVDLNVPQAGDWEYCGEWVPADEGCEHGHVSHRSMRNSAGVFLCWEGQVGYGADWEEMLQGGLQTALESQVLVFEVQGVSRTCTHQLVRTRNAAFHQQSQRASFYGTHPEARMPESVWRNPRARAAWLRAKLASDEAYAIACQEDISYQDARYVLLEGTDNYIMCEYSVREFINVFNYRGCSMFSWEIVHVMREMRRLLLEAHPWLEPYVKISCEKTGTECTACKGTGTCQVCGGAGGNEPSTACPVCMGGECVTCDGHGGTGRKCTFQGWESVERQCDFPWANQDNRTFISTAHGITRRPGMNAISQGPAPLPKRVPGQHAPPPDAFPSEHLSPSSCKACGGTGDLFDKERQEWIPGANCRACQGTGETL